MSPRRPAPTNRPVVLTVAGSDSGGGAGIQADIKAIEATGCFAASALTAVTAQHTRGVERVDVLDPAAVTAQVEAVLDDFEVAAVKTGMLATKPIVETVADLISTVEVPVVVDPVMVAASGDRLLDERAVDAYDDLFERATLVTPNADEASLLTDTEVRDEERAITAGERLIEAGARGGLVKGGHWGEGPITDVLVTANAVESILHSRIDTDATHGSGCMLASTIAARLAIGDDLGDAVHSAIASLERAVRYHHAVGRGPGAVHHLVELRNDAAVQPTIDDVRGVVDWIVDANAATLIPEVGMNVVGALPFAERPDETVAVDGRLTRTIDGVHRGGDVRRGASDHVARLLLAVREYDPSVRFAANCRFGEAIRDALEGAHFTVVEVDRQREPDDVGVREGRTMSWVVDAAFESDEGTPAAIYDRGAVGKEAMTRLLATSADQLQHRLQALANALQGSTPG